MELCKKGRMNKKHNTALQVTTGHRYRNLSQSRFYHTTPHNNTPHSLGHHIWNTRKGLAHSCPAPRAHSASYQTRSDFAYSITNCSLPHSHFQPQPWSPVTVVTLLTGLAKCVLG
jgi:hypothetical protein